MSEPARPWWDPRRPAGFRFSAIDALIVGLCVPATWALWPAVDEMALVCPVALGHFFLFCNVFRLGRRAELLWGAAFVVNACAWTWFEAFTWPRVVLAQAPVTLGAIAVAIGRKDYHGVGHRLLRRRRGTRVGR